MTTEFDLAINPAGVEAYLRSDDSPVQRELQLIATRALVLLRFYSPRNSGALADSWEKTKVGDSWVLHSDKEYVVYIVKGTAPHRIKARNARVLAWDSPEGPAFAAWVMHPGTQPNDFVTAALRDALG